MASDFRMPFGWFEHPKLADFRDLLGDEWADRGEVCLYRLWKAVAVHYPTGDLSGKTETFIEKLAQWDGEQGRFAQILRRARLLDGEPLNSHLHEWSKHQPHVAGSKEKSETNSENAKERWRQVREKQETEARLLGTHSAMEWSAMCEAHDFKCARCRAESELEKDHVTPLGKPGCSDAISNLQPLCRFCNASKKAATAEYRRKDWREAIGQILSRMRRSCDPHAVRNAPTNQPTIEATPKERVVGMLRRPVKSAAVGQ